MVFYRRWFKIGAGLAVSVVTITLLFTFLINHYGFEITGEDDICAGTLADPCISKVWIKNPTKYNVDVYNPDNIKLDFSPEIKDYKLFYKDGRCSGKEGSACCSPDGVCFAGWHWFDLTPATKPRKDTSYVYRFPAYDTKEWLVWGLKNNKYDRVKWDFEFDGEGLANGYLDPIWSYDSSQGGDGSLVGHYKFDGDVLDSSGYSNNAEVSGAVVTNDGKFKQGYELNNSDLINSTIELSDGNVTFSAWFRTANTDDNHILISENTDTGHFVRLMLFDNNFLFGVNQTFVQSTGGLSNNLWYHIAGTWNSTDSILYVNGVEFT